MSAARQPVIAVYAGTFDPLTLGHEDLMRRASGLFDRVIVAVAMGHHKRTLFDVEERLSMVRERAADLPNVSAVPFSGLLTQFLREQGARVVVRGIRGITDFDYEFQMAGMNRNLMPDIETLFLMPSASQQFVSGSFIREISALGGDVAPYVAPSILARLQQRRAAQAS
jgi:pantetheine-phosphate adenylyltransferase